MSETTCGDHEGKASPSEGASTQGTPKPAPDPEVIEFEHNPYLRFRYVTHGPRYLT